MIVLTLSAVMFLQQCAPDIDARAMAALVLEQSAWNPYSVVDRETGQRWVPHSLSQAEELVRALHARALTLGYSGLDTNMLAALQISLPRAFDGCANLRIADRVLLAEASVAPPYEGRWAFALRAFTHDDARVDAIITARDMIELPLPGAPDLAPPIGATR